MDKELLNRIVDVFGNAIWTGRFPLKPKAILARDFSNLSGLNTGNELSGHELMEIRRLRSEAPAEFCASLADIARERVMRDFADTPRLRQAMLEVSGLQ